MPPVRYFREVLAAEIEANAQAYRRKRFYQTLALSVMAIGFVLILLGLAIQ